MTDSRPREQWSESVTHGIEDEPVFTYCLGWERGGSLGNVGSGGRTAEPPVCFTGAVRAKLMLSEKNNLYY